MKEKRKTKTGGREIRGKKKMRTNKKKKKKGNREKNKTRKKKQVCPKREETQDAVRQLRNNNRCLNSLSLTPRGAWRKPLWDKTRSF